MSTLDETRPRTGDRLEVEVRELTYADLPDVIALDRCSFSAPWSFAMFVLELSKPASVCLGAFRDEQLCGHLICSRYHTVWHLMNVAVAPDDRRMGIATSLIHHLFDRTGAGEPYTLEVRVSNDEAIYMYERFGFRTAGIRRSYYHNDGEDAVIMWRSRE